MSDSWTDPEITRRFWGKTRRTQNGCLEWTGCCAPNGYGQFAGFSGDRQAHRIAWRIARGPIPAGLLACHKCDNRKCVDVDHLFLGTHSDNMRDMVAKGRHNTSPGGRAAANIGRRFYRGDKNAAAKLTERDAIIAKACPMRRGAAAALAASLGVSETVICGIRRGLRWSHLPEPDQEARQRAEALVRVIEEGNR